MIASRLSNTAFLKGGLPNATSGDAAEGGLQNAAWMMPPEAVGPKEREKEKGKERKRETHYYGVWCVSFSFQSQYLSQGRVNRPLVFGASGDIINTVYGYDADGLRTKRTDGSSTWTYTYDANGMRTKRTNGSTTYEYVYNGGTLSQMTVGSDTLNFTYDASGRPLSVSLNGTTYYYVTNLQGDVTAILNTSGTAVVQYTYDAWGNALTTTGSMASTLGTLNPLRYRGYVYDTETGFYYLQSRYYDPQIGRFINADAFTSTGQGLLGNNMFAYCLNNPVNNLDLSGFSSSKKTNTPFVVVIIIDGGSGDGSAGGGGIEIGSIIIALIDALIKSMHSSSYRTTRENDDAVFYGADIIGGEWHKVTGEMDFFEAAQWAISTAVSGKYSDRASWGLYTENKADARAMTLYLGKSIYYTHDDKKRGHYAHFHTAFRQIFGVNAKSFHMWYGEKGE